MAGPTTSQWDFGELFPTTPTRKVLSVSQLTWQIRQLLEEQVGQVWVAGEVTDLSTPGSGHVYFTLKDASANLKCVLFRREHHVDRSLLQHGRKLTLQGDVTVYEKGGYYQLRVTKVELHGIGALQAAFEKLKQKLDAEGLFAQERKRPVPRYPQRIGLVTSPTGAVIRDVLDVAGRRNPALQMILAPCRVQGEGAAVEIASAIRLLNEFNDRSPRSREAGEDAAGGYLDLILVTRGGGSLEDLWSFNEEVVARAIFQSSLPVVSAIGHRTDYTISDFVADFQAPTPSAAAEIITEGVLLATKFVAESPRRMNQAACNELADCRRQQTQLLQRLGHLHPRRRFENRQQRLDELQTRLLRCARLGVSDRNTAAQQLLGRLLRVRPAISQRRKALDQTQRRLREKSVSRLREWKARVETLEARLRLLGPEQVLARGYSITLDAQTGNVVRGADEVSPGQRLRTRLKKGEVLSKVEGR